MLPIKVIKKLEGKIMTIIDASFVKSSETATTSLSEDVRVEAIKSLIRQEIKELYNYVVYDYSDFEERPLVK